MRRYADTVARYRGAFECASAWPEEPLAEPIFKGSPREGAPVCLLFAPHPDDEALSGAAALKLRAEGWRVVVVAVTLGSKRARRAARWREMQASCAYLGFELVSASGEAAQGLERIGPDAREAEPVHWQAAVLRIRALITLFNPTVILCPHADDGHSAHVGTYHLVLDALRDWQRATALHLLLSEYWNTQSQPRLRVGLSDEAVAQLMQATALHVGEVARNPYHLSFPAWLMDSARRGVERVGAPGSHADDTVFAALYGWQIVQDRQWRTGSATDVPQNSALSQYFRRLG